jgi:hypothetical protein
LFVARLLYRIISLAASTISRANPASGTGIARFRALSAHLSDVENCEGTTCRKGEDAP